MSDIVTKICDVCGKTKGPSNSWFQIWKNRVSVAVIFDVQQALDLGNSNPSPQDVCGEECALRLIQKKLEESRNAR